MGFACNTYMLTVCTSFATLALRLICDIARMLPDNDYGRNGYPSIQEMWMNVLSYNKGASMWFNIRRESVYGVGIIGDLSRLDRVVQSRQGAKCQPGSKKYGVRGPFAT